MKRELIIVIAGASVTSADMPALETLLARGDPCAPPGTSAEQCLSAMFGHGPELTLPNAALLALGEGLDAGTAYWLRADPVSLAATRTRLALTELAPGALSPADADALGGTLEALFATAGCALVMAHPQRWYLRMDAAPALRTQPPSACAGLLEETHLPSGPDAGAWKRMITEAQMLLHEHPVNVAREAAGEPPANAVWPWGGGRLPSGSAPRCRALWCCDRLGRGLARAANVPVWPLPADARGLLAALDADPDARAPALAYASLTAGPLPPADFDRAWFAVLRDALRDARLDALTVIVCRDRGPVARRIVRPHLRRWWRRRVALHAYD